MVKRTPEEIAIFKSLLVESISDGIITTHALRDLGITYAEMRGWMKSDSVFASALAEAQETCTELKADSILEVHNIVPDPKRAAVHMRGLERWLAWRNPKTFGDKPNQNDDRPQLLDILRAAIDRVQIPAQQPVPLVPLPAPSEQHPDTSA